MNQLANDAAKTVGTILKEHNIPFSEVVGKMRCLQTGPAVEIFGVPGQKNGTIDPVIDKKLNTVFEIAAKMGINARAYFCPQPEYERMPTGGDLVDGDQAIDRTP